MRPLSRRLALAAALAAGLFGAAAQVAVAQTPAPADMTLGDPKAKVTVVEYASTACPHCAHWNADVWPAFKAKYVDTGKVYYTLKEFLTPPEEAATAGWLVARCAGKDKYFTVVDTLFRTQQDMFASGDFRGALLRVAQSAGMTEAQFNACVQDEKALADLDARVQKAIKDDDISATPTFFMNGKKVKEGEATLAELDAAVAEASK